MTSTLDARPATDGVHDEPAAAPWIQRLFLRRESAGLVMLALCIYIGTQLSSTFWAPHYLLFDSGQYIEIGLLALVMTLLIVMGEIDLSVGAAAGLAASILADLTDHGTPVGVAVLVAVVVGAACGLVNGVLVIRLKVPSLVVTLGTMAVFRGLAEVVIGPRSVSLPESFVGLDTRGFTGTSYDLPVELVVFLVVAAGFTVLLHRAVYGQLALTIGANSHAARYSGIRVDRIRLLAFTATGAMAGVVGVLYASRVGAVTYQAGSGYELLAITVVVLGGTDIFGGRGSIPATVIALASVMALKEAMGLKLYNGATQDAVVGVLLVMFVVVPLLLRRLAASRAHQQSSRAGRRGDDE